MLGNPGAAEAAVSRILTSAKASGAEGVVSSCPLCEYNIGKRQASLIEKKPEVPKLPTFYVTQLLALALGADPGGLRFDLNHEGALPLIEEKVLD